MIDGVFKTFGIPHLDTKKSNDDLLVVDRFKTYLAQNPHLNAVHRHSFYHLLYFTEGAGEHTIDFVHFPVKKGMIYFMKPGQVHKWDFTGPVDGYIVNFSPTYFDQLGIPSHLLNQFSFFDSNIHDQVMELSAQNQIEVTRELDRMVQEHGEKLPLNGMMIAACLLRLFILVSRGHSGVHQEASLHYNHRILKNFQDLLELNFKTMKLPKQYAALLYVTPNHLNALCKDLLGLPAGEVIRDRVLLEAKRLLVNKDLMVGSIAAALNFPDSSYFVKFFKKYTGLTPESFRQKNYK